MTFVRTIQQTVAATIVVGVVACDSAPTPGLARGEEVFDTCAPCHGTDGAGNYELLAPAIAGLPAWYITSQLEKYQNGQRGSSPFDTVGIRMKSMSLALDVDGDLESVAEYVSGLPGIDAPASLHDGDANAGQQAYALCAACHGANGEGNEALNAPPLMGQYDWYLMRQLKKFKTGSRGSATGDIGGAIMRPNAMTMDDATMANVVAYIEAMQ